MAKSGKSAAARNAVARTAAETTALSTAAGGMVLASLYARDAMAESTDTAGGVQSSDQTVFSSLVPERMATNGSSPPRHSEGDGANSAPALAAAEMPAGEMQAATPGEASDTPEGAHPSIPETQARTTDDITAPKEAGDTAERGETASAEAVPLVKADETPGTQTAQSPKAALDEIDIAGFTTGMQSSVGAIVDQAVAAVPQAADVLAGVPTADDILNAIRPGIEETIESVMSAVPTAEGIAALASLPVEILGGSVDDEADFWGGEAVGDLVAPVEAIAAGAVNLVSSAGDGALSLGFLGQSYQDEAAANDPGGLALSPGLSGLI